MVFIPGLSHQPFDPYAQPPQAPQGPFGGFQPGGVPANILQSLAPPEPVSVTRAAQDLQTASPQIPQQNLPDPSSFKEARPRRSFLETIGRISDVLAQVGGADPLYQPTLDARDDRARAIDIEALKRHQLEQQIGAADETSADQGRVRIGMALKGLQAIQARGGDVNAAWPILAQQAGLHPDQTSQIAALFQSNPALIPGIAETFGQEREYGLQPFFAQDEHGNLKAYQLGKDGTIQPVNLPDGSAPIDPTKFVDTGGAQVGYGTRSGRVQRILPKTERPGYSGGQPIKERPGFSGGRPIAPAPGKEGSGPSPAGLEQVLSNIGELRGIYGDLKKQGAMVSPGQSTGTNIIARTRASGIGQLAEGFVGTDAQTKRDRIGSIRPGLMQSLAKATGMTGKQLDSNADVQLFMKTVTDPTASYEANIAALDGLERWARANAKQPAAAAPRAAPRPAPRRGPARVTPRGGGRGPTVSNW